ncbi:MAG: segregation/condensation protein A [Alphaproteobacteria bacterium]|jgi:segregation and condensation protein A|nr:segregation/condensation protein A [Alphaproteobacteria bacterium]
MSDPEAADSIPETWSGTGEAEALSDEAFIVRLEAYEGPLDVLLDQARRQTVDLAQISILALVDQYLGFIEQARRLRIELAADYLVMAAWLAYLKSRLLLPPPEKAEEPSAEELGEALARRLRVLEAMRKAGTALMARPRLGVDLFPRGQPDLDPVAEVPVYATTLYDLLKAYADIRRPGRQAVPLRLVPDALDTIDDAVGRLRTMLGHLPGWSQLSAFLPEGRGSALARRGALAATFGASLELAKRGELDLRQDEPFGPLYVRRREGGA